MSKLKLQKFASQKNQAGFTIIESLVAVIVLGILMTAIAPTIVLSTATRVQSRRVELATQAARAYIDGVSSGNIPAPPVSKTDAVKAPTGKLNCKTNELKKNKGYCSSPKDSTYQVFCVDGTGDAQCTKDESKDLIVQAFGYNPDSTVSTPEASRGYRLNVRIYRADAFKDNGALIKNETNKKATQSTFTGGIGKRKAPLVEMTTEIVTGRTTFQNLCSRLKNTSNKNSNCGN